MKILDKNIPAKVDVYVPSCLTRPCYWPRTNPGVFTQGRGYRNPSKDWLCGTRQAHGCPTDEENDTI